MPILIAGKLAQTSKPTFHMREASRAVEHWRKTLAFKTDKVV
jgi:hypothetical protein